MSDRQLKVWLVAGTLTFLLIVTTPAWLIPLIERCTQ
jgi:hypothetical protein